MLIFSRIWILFTVFNQIRLKNYQIKKNKIFNFLHKISQKRHFVAQKRQFSSSVSRKWPSGETTWRQKPRWRWCLWRHGRPWPCEWVAGDSLTGWAKRTSRGFTPGGARKKSVVAHKSLFYNKLDTSRVDETITLKIAYYLISNDLSATPKLNARLSPDGPAGSCRKGLSSARRG